MLLTWVNVPLYSPNSSENEIWGVFTQVSVCDLKKREKTLIFEGFYVYNSVDNQ